MNIPFVKYQGTGNDFIMLDGREQNYHFSSEEIQKICDRKFGVGADGLIILKEHPSLDFEMDYYNADGSKSFCGNGSRCAQAYAMELGMIQGRSEFLAIDGQHQGEFSDGVFATHMGDVDETAIEQKGDDWFIHTGSPHYIVFSEDVDRLDVKALGSNIRYSEEYKEEGTNVNFVELKNDHIKVRTYERGVEDETLSCGTGVTAAAIAYTLKVDSDLSKVIVETLGGQLSIRLNRDSNRVFNSIWLVGPATKVFEGIYSKQ